MKIFLPLTFTILASTYGTKACAEDSWYLGALYSAQKISSGEEALNIPSQIDFNAVGIVAGNTFNKYFALEARLIKGISGYSETFEYLKPIKPETFHNEDLDSQLSLLIRASYPIYETFSIYGLAGYTTSRIKANGITANNNSYSHSEIYNDFTYGVGLNYQLTKEINLFVDYQVLPEYELGFGHSKEWESTTVGVNYSF